MKKAVSKLLKKFNLQISRINKENPAFIAQQRLKGQREDKLTIFDVGAYQGLIAQDYNRLFPGADIYCFEPFPESFSVLTANTSRLPNIRRLPYGLGAATGPQVIHANAFAATNSLLSTDSEGATTWGKGLLETQATVSVEIKTLDDAMAELNLDHIDILKLDVQGAEHLVLDGGSKTLSSGNVDLIYTEIILLPTYEGQLYFDEILLRFRQLGYRLYDVYNPSYNQQKQLRQVDAIFTKA